MHDVLYHAQHGFTAARSTVTNLLCFDAVVASIISRNHAYDIIISVDFKKAFDKAPHHVLRTLSDMGILV